MTDFELPYVNAQRGRDGRIRYWYFRRAGRRWPLPGKPLSEEFMADYRRLLTATEPTARVGRTVMPPGTFGALVAAFFGDKQAFGEKKPSTQRIYRVIRSEERRVGKRGR